MLLHDDDHDDTAAADDDRVRSKTSSILIELNLKHHLS
jgi:hypothetical protein